MRLFRSMSIRPKAYGRWAQGTLLLPLIAMLLISCTPAPAIPLPEPPVQPIPQPTATAPDAGISFTARADGQCQTFLFNENQDVTHGPCDGALTTTPFVEADHSGELAHYLETFQPFAMETPNGSIDFVGWGQTQPAASEQRSVAAWVQLEVNEINAGRSSAGEGLVMGWHREGGLAGFCDDLAVYETGVAKATSCKNGQAQNLGQIWLTGDQLTQLYAWLDNLGRFEYAPASDASADAMTLDLFFAGQGGTAASKSDQQEVETFAAALYAQGSLSVSGN